MDYKKIFNDYKNIIIALIGIVIIFIFLIVKSIPTITSIIKIKNDIKNTNNSIADKERQVADLEQKQQEMEQELAEQKETDLSKPFFKSIDTGLDTESVIANEFTEILTIIRANSIKTKSIQYEYDPKDDNFVRNAGASFNVARLKLEMIGSYKNFESFLKELYKHEHFVDIEGIEIIPYEKNKRILLINFTMKLYAQKS